MGGGSRGKNKAHQGNGRWCYLGGVAREASWEVALEEKAGMKGDAGQSLSEEGGSRQKGKQNRHWNLLQVVLKNAMRLCVAYHCLFFFF
jgi:hypothetical protein